MDRNSTQTYVEKMAQILMSEGDIETAKALRHLAKTQERMNMYVGKDGNRMLLVRANGSYSSGNFERATVRVTAMRRSEGAGSYELTLTLRDFAEYLGDIGQRISAKSTLDLVGLIKNRHLL